MNSLGPRDSHIEIQAINGKGHFGVEGKDNHAKLVMYDEKGGISRVFNVKIGSEKTSNRDVLEKLATLLNKHVPEEVKIDTGDRLLIKSKGIRHFTATDKKTKYDFRTAEYQTAFKEVSGSFKTAVKAASLGSSILQSIPQVKETVNADLQTINSRYDPKLLAERLLQKYKDPQKLLAAINGLLADDIRFNRGNEFFEIGPEFNAVIDVLQSKISEASEAITCLTQKEYAAMQKLQKQVATELVGLCIRKEVEARPISDGTYMCQVSGHVGSDGKFSADGKTISSLLQKEEKNVLEIANHAVISIKDQYGDSDEVVLSRSARTDTAQKILDKSKADIQARLLSSSKNGLAQVTKEDGTTYYEYQRVDVTLMDTNIMKSVATTMRSGARNLKGSLSRKKNSPVENERAFVRNKKRAVKEVWEGKDAKVDPLTSRRYIEHTFDHQVVREYEPQVVNFVFSGQAKKPENVARARQENIEPAIVLFKTILDKSSMPEGLSRNCREAFAMTDARTRNEQLATHIKNSIGSSSLDPTLKSVCRAMLVMLTGKDEQNRDYDNKDGSDQQFLLFNLLSEVAGAALSVECKSGNDRSLTAVSLACSAKEWKRAHEGQLYDPTQHSDDSHEFKAFRHGFNTYAIAFGPQNLLAARGPGKNGKPDLKTGKSPVFMKYAQGLDATFNILGQKPKTV